MTMLSYSGQLFVVEGCDQAEPQTEHAVFKHTQHRWLRCQVYASLQLCPRIDDHKRLTLHASSCETWTAKEKRFTLSMLHQMPKLNIHDEFVANGDSALDIDLQTLKEWQPAIGATAGFTGVILAMLYNAHSGRKLVKINRRNEAATLSTAIRHEVTTYFRWATFVTRMLREMESTETSFIDIRPIGGREVFTANIARIGILTQRKVADTDRLSFAVGDIRLSAEHG